MSSDLGVCRFDNGEIRFFIYDGTVDVCDPRLHSTPDEAWDVWRADESDFFPRVPAAAMESAEPVDIVTFYGAGSHWRGTASLHEAMLVHGRKAEWFLADEDDKSPTKREGVPTWASSFMPKWRRDVLGSKDQS